ncbi:hypothetical protein MHU86_9365 [Fragilaria crotonensis]|nr:hypothetical protein MHU86_9365 [Fragilaria crotonensis]
MDDEDQEDVNPLMGGVEDVDNNMIDTMFDLSAYVSDNDDEDADSDDDLDSGPNLGGRNNGRDHVSQGWTYLSGPDAPNISISIDGGVDKRLLERARQEVPTVLLKVKRKIYGKRHRNVRQISPGECLKAFMDPHFLGYMKAYINTNMSSDDAVSSSDVIAFIRVELMLSFYKVSPSMFFDPGNISNFPSSASGMSQSRYAQILRGLNAASSRAPPVQLCGSTHRTLDCLSLGVWQPPMSHNRELATAMAIVRRTCAELAFIPGTTDIGLDDDLLRLRSRKVVLEGYSQTNNPNKGLGVIHHGAVSNCTSLYCGGHVASRKESTIDCVKILLLALSGASIESQISLNRTKFFWDRGYGGVEGEVNSFAIEKGAVLVGTSRRMKSFPFTFDQHPGPSRRLIQEKGTTASYWAVRNLGRNRQFALAHRSGLGRVVLMHTTDESLGPGRYTLITKRRKDATIRYAIDDDPVLSYIESGDVTRLTESQRTHV